jgi:hypothetical protein
MLLRDGTSKSASNFLNSVLAIAWWHRILVSATADKTNVCVPKKQNHRKRKYKKTACARLPTPKLFALHQSKKGL